MIIITLISAFYYIIAEYVIDVDSKRQPEVNEIESTAQKISKKCNKSIWKRTKSISD